MRWCWAGTAVLLLSGCGRLGFEPLGDVELPDASGDAVSMDSTMDSTVEDTAAMGDGSVPTLTMSVDGCDAEAMTGAMYSCRPTLNREPIAEETFTFMFADDNACAWAGIEVGSGEVSGTPTTEDEGACVLAVGVRSSLGPEAEARRVVHVGGPTDIRQLDIGAWHACALSIGNAVRCWGLNTSGQLGYDDRASVGNGTPGRSIADMGNVEVGGPVSQISLAYFQTCALLATGGVRCWGAGSFGRLGYAHGEDVGDGGAGGTIVDNGDIPLGGEATDVEAGGVGGCVRMSAGGVRCWGQNNGNGVTQITGAAIAAAGNLEIGAEVVEIAGGYNHYCVLTASGNVRCWGQNWAGSLGYDHTDTVGDGAAGMSILDMGDVNVGGRVVQISAGDQTTCAVLDSGALRCWGWNHEGQLGYGDTQNVGDGTSGRSIVDMGDVPVGGPVRMAWAGEEHTCAVMTTGMVRCWGSSREGQLGYGDTLNVGDGTSGRAILDMGDVNTGGTVRHVVTTDWDTGFTCALMTSGGVRCWGNNSSGELGVNDTLPIGEGTRAITAVPEVHPFLGASP